MLPEERQRVRMTVKDSNYWGRTQARNVLPGRGFAHHPGLTRLHGPKNQVSRSQTDHVAGHSMLFELGSLVRTSGMTAPMPTRQTIGIFLDCRRWYPPCQHRPSAKFAVLTIFGHRTQLLVYGPRAQPEI